ncbi:MAG: hypothetical protein H6718_06540 [Polyangiaceae bacterium]|nr:hypothetical protein [Myxococcales bacterium]MCB9585037.1 hypothetical protein [Polyangiaceae bacterium]MCB9610072.1 hypothetical protein [Polyangiaceae bacterium]
MERKLVKPEPVTLTELVGRLPSLDDDAVICGRKPWVAEGEFVVVSFNEDYSIPLEVQDLGYVYFLEVSLARDVLSSRQDEPLNAAVDLLLYYAEWDAYPE